MIVCIIKVWILEKSFNKIWLIITSLIPPDIPDPNVVSNKIIVSNKLLGLLRLGLGLG